VTAAPQAPDVRPLAGFRVVDLTVAWAGPFGAMLLGDLGAEVLRVENIHVWLSHTRNWRARPTRREVPATDPITSGYPYGEPGDRPWERSPAYVPLHRNRRSVTIDVRTERGRGYLKRLVEVSDVVYDNNVPETLEKLGITWEAVSAWNPRAIMFRAPAYGLRGEYRNYRAWGTHIEAVLGHTLLRGYPDADPSGTPPVYACDFQTGVIGAFAVMAALFARERSGKGQLVELSQAENGLSLFPQAIMDWTLNGVVQATTGNRGVHGEAPSGVYACRAGGWIAIDVCEDAEWRALANVFGRPELADAPEFATAEARRARLDELDSVLGELTRERDATALMHALQAAGVPAGEVQRADQAYHCPHLRGRGFFERLENRYTGAHDYPGLMFRMPASGLRIDPPTTLGEFNEYVYREILGLGEAEYEELVASGEIGDTFDETIR
jgi:crotonobetainyl-CoA:carnitine CoA-transferase CaiB-like acyl-CoA transferase